MAAPLSIAVLGFGGRAETLTKYAFEHPEEIVIKVIAEHNAARRAKAKEIFGDTVKIFERGEDFYNSGIKVDGVWVITKEKTHADLAVPALELGLPLICEKPISNKLEDAYRISNAFEANPVPFVIPHSLRYLPLYRKIKECILSGELGRLLHIHAIEAITDRHTVSYYRRGPGRFRKDTTILLAKSSHDLDIINWMMGGVKAKSIACFGGQDYLKARPDVPDRCTTDCPELTTCGFGPHSQQVDAGEAVKIDPDTDAVFDEKVCAWNSGSDQVDHQTIIIQYEDGTTVDFTIRCFGGGGRSMLFTGSHGSLFSEKKEVRLVKYRPFSKHIFDDSEFPSEGPHGGGDWALLHDWYEAVTTGNPSNSATVHESTEAIALCEAADLAMMENRVVSMAEVRANAQAKINVD